MYRLHLMGTNHTISSVSNRATNRGSIPMYIVAGTALDVHSSSCDGSSRTLAIMDAATDGTATPVA
jgi:hypothetical protein